MACFGGPTYHDIPIEKEVFIPIAVRIGGQTINILCQDDKIYSQLQRGLEEKKQMQQIEEQKASDRKKASQVKAQEVDKLKKELIAKEQVLDDSKNEIKHLNNQIELLNELQSQIQQQQQPNAQNQYLTQQRHMHLSNASNISGHYSANSIGNQLKQAQSPQSHISDMINLNLQGQQQFSNTQSFPPGALGLHLNPLSPALSKASHNILKNASDLQTERYEQVDSGNRSMSNQRRNHLQIGEDHMYYIQPELNQISPPNQAIAFTKSFGAQHTNDEQQQDLNLNHIKYFTTSNQGYLSQPNHPQQNSGQVQADQILDQMSSIFEMVAQYFDRRFFELQEFIYHFNKAVLSSNKNYTLIAQSIQGLKNASTLEILQPFRLKKDEKKLSEELREHISTMLKLNNQFHVRNSNDTSSCASKFQGSGEKMGEAAIIKTNTYNTVGNNASHNVNSSLTSSLNQLGHINQTDLDKQEAQIQIQNQELRMAALKLASQGLQSEQETNKLLQNLNPTSIHYFKNQIHQQQLQAQLKGQELIQQLKESAAQSPIRNSNEDLKRKQNLNNNERDENEPISYSLPLQQQSAQQRVLKEGVMKRPILNAAQNSGSQAKPPKEESEVCDDDSDQEQATPSQKNQMFTGNLININNNNYNILLTQQQQLQQVEVATHQLAQQQRMSTGNDRNNPTYGADIEDNDGHSQLQEILLNQDNEGDFVLIGEDDNQAHTVLNRIQNYQQLANQSPLQTGLSNQKRAVTSLGQSSNISTLSINNHSSSIRQTPQTLYKKHLKARSPPYKAAPTQLQTHQKSKLQKRSPMNRSQFSGSNTMSFVGVEQKLNSSSRITSDDLLKTESQLASFVNESGKEAQGKSPFINNQKQGNSSQTRYNDIQQQKQSFISKGANHKSTSNLSKVNQGAGTLTNVKTKSTRVSHLASGSHNSNPQQNSAHQTQRQKGSKSPLGGHQKDQRTNHNSHHTPSAQISLQNFQSSRNNQPGLPHSSLTENKHNQNSKAKLQSYQSAQNTDSTFNSVRQAIEKSATTAPQIIQGSIATSNQQSVKHQYMSSQVQPPALHLSQDLSADISHIQYIVNQMNAQSAGNHHQINLIPGESQNAITDTVKNKLQISKHLQQISSEQAPRLSSGSNRSKQSEKQKQVNSSNNQILKSQEAIQTKRSSFEKNKNNSSRTQTSFVANHIMVLNQQSPSISNKSSIVSDDDRGAEKQINYLDTSSKSQGLIVISPNGETNNYANYAQSISSSSNHCSPATVSAAPLMNASLQNTEMKQPFALSATLTEEIRLRELSQGITEQDIQNLEREEEELEQQRMSIASNSVANIFEKNLEKLNQRHLLNYSKDSNAQGSIVFLERGNYDEGLELDAHRLTLDQVAQSIDIEPGKAEEQKNYRLMNRDNQASSRKSMNHAQLVDMLNRDPLLSVRQSEIREINSHREYQGGTNTSNPQYPLKPLGSSANPAISILDTDNLFGQQTLYPQEIDLSQYNSPSFAAGAHLGNQMFQIGGGLQSHRQSQQQQSYGVLGSSVDAKDRDLIIQQQYQSSSSSRDSVDNNYLNVPHHNDSKQIIHIQNTVRQKTLRTGFLKIHGHLLAAIGDYLGEKLPLFMFTNRITFKVSLQYQIEHYEHQRQLIMSQAFAINRELERMRSSTKFDLSPQSQEEYEALERRDWDELILVCHRHGLKQDLNPPLKQKNIIILRLYLTFMGLDLAEDPDDFSFLEQCGDFMRDCGDQVAEVMDPERSFLITDDNKKRIKELLVNLQKEKLVEDEGSSRDLGRSTDSLNATINNARILETFTNLLFEALQFVNIIPNVLVQDMRAEMDELKKVAEAFNGIKNNLIDFKNLVA